MEESLYLLWKIFHTSKSQQAEDFPSFQNVFCGTVLFHLKTKVEKYFPSNILCLIQLRILGIQAKFLHYYVQNSVGSEPASSKNHNLKLSACSYA